MPHFYKITDLTRKINKYVKQNNNMSKEPTTINGGWFTITITKHVQRWAKRMAE